MRTWIKSGLVMLFAVCFSTLIWFLVKDHSIPLLEPKGSIALQQRNLILIAASLMLLVVIPVFFLTILISWRYRASNVGATYLPNWEHNALEEFIWWAVPFVIIAVLASITWKTTHALDPFRPIPGKSLTIQVVSLNWKWLFIYPHEGVATVNEVVFPTSRPVEFQITSDAPMNSFWIPQLGGQIYAMTGMVTKLHLITDVPGIYQGSSSNLSGKGFSGMRFEAKAVPEELYRQWVDSLKASPELTAHAYTALSAPSEREPVRYYGAVDDNLFETIISKYGEGSMKAHHK